MLVYLELCRLCNIFASPKEKTGRVDIWHFPMVADAFQVKVSRLHGACNMVKTLATYL